MKKIFLPLAFVALLTSCGNPNEVTENFQVYGNCMMCEETIEGSLKEVDGIILGDWDKKTKQIAVTFDSTRISLNNIKSKIAEVGYDTENFRAEDDVYDGLHKCCKYQRPE
ncbi:MAG: mercuric ion binding protein [Saprospiraceae bacterium]|jgi:mercuric ion binding protein